MASPTDRGSGQSTYVFHEFSLDESARTLRREGEQVALSPRVFALLSYLVRHSARAISSEELRDAVWNVEAISDSAIPTAIATLRKALLDDAAEPEIIRTVRGYGYQFVADVSEIGPNQGLAPIPEPAGRNHELDILLRALNDAESRVGRVVLVTGEAGIGKTALLDAFSMRAAASHRTVLRLNCREAPGAPPFWPWRSALAPFGDFNFAGDALRPGADAPDNHPIPTEGDGLLTPREARLRLYADVAIALAEIAANKTLVILFDDLHFADGPSLELLASISHAMRTARVLMVGTSRTSTIRTTRDDVEQVEFRLEPSLQVHLTGLEPGASRAIVDKLCPGAHPGWSELLHEATAGNPLLIQQLVQTYQSNSDLSTPPPESLPDAVDGIALSVTSHTAGLTGSEILVLYSASVLGHEFDSVEVAKIASVDHETALELLDRVEELGLVRHSHANETTFRFSHELIRRSVYQRISTREKVKLHDAAAVVIEQQTRGLPGPRSSELLHHCARSSRAGTVDRDVQAATCAVDWAIHVLGYEDAERHTQWAVRHLEQHSPWDRARIAQTKIRLAVAESLCGSTEKGRATLIDAYRLADVADAPLVQADAALTLAPPFTATAVGEVDSVAISMLQRALTRLPPGETVRRSELLSRLSIAHTWSQQETQLSEYSGSALQLARESGDSNAIAHALCATHGTLWHPDDFERRAEVLDELGEIALALPDHRAVLAHQVLLATYDLEVGDIARCDQTINALLSAAEELRMPEFLWQGQLLMATRLHMSGRAREASRVADLFRETGERIHAGNVSHCYLAHQLLQRLHDDDLANAANVAARGYEELGSLPTWPVVAAYVLVRAGEKDRARELALAYANTSWRRAPHNEVWGATLAFFAETVSGIEACDIAQELYAQLTPWSSHFRVMGFGASFHGSYDRPLGMLAATLGLESSAHRHYRAAIDADARIGALASRAESLRAYADFLQSCGAAEYPDIAAEADRAVQDLKNIR